MLSLPPSLRPNYLTPDYYYYYYYYYYYHYYYHYYYYYYSSSSPVHTFLPSLVNNPQVTSPSCPANT